MLSSLPGSNFNEANECHWCQVNYPAYVPCGADKLQEFLDRNRSKTDAADCLVGVSGGKDSSYVLLELKETFGMKVEAVTYNHDGLAPFALENARRVCRNVDVPHHVVSLPNHEHVELFKTFFQTWLDQPRPLAAAMSCAGCKHMHILATRLAVDRNIPMLVWGTCPLENPPFLVLRVESSEERPYGRAGLLKSTAQLVGEMFNYPGLATSFVKHFSTCTFGCLATTPDSRYLALRYPSKKQIYFFQYVNWDATVIRSTLETRTDWRLPEDVTDDWHSDCVIVSLKEYMFQKMLGVSYTEAFLSNQIRHGRITREEAWAMTLESKKQAPSAVMRSLDYLGLDHLKDRIDLSCFDISL
jgi:predicted subunit of tRNA(5-methylaminomethyl-2-thiouridylate) methyltransferase